MNKKILVQVSAVLAILVLGFYLFFDRLAISIFAATHNMNITYTDLVRKPAGEFTANKLNILNKKTGAGLFAESSDFKIRYTLLPPKMSSLDFDLKNVNFHKEGKAETADYSNIENLASVPFQSKWRYTKVSGEVTLAKNGIRINRLDAAGDEIRLSIKGLLYDDGTVDTDITIYFAGNITSKMPGEMSGVLLRDEKDGWKSLSVSLKGNVETPAIQISGKLFRLNVSAVSMDTGK